MASHAALRWRRFASLGFGGALLGAALSGCAQHPHPPAPTPRVHEAGPPPWAPAHGHRRKHHEGAELVFDAGLGVYVVVGYENSYFHEDRYYRHRDGRWVMSAHLRGPWLTAAVGDLPVGLRSKGEGKHRGRGQGPPAKARGRRH